MPQRLCHRLLLCAALGLGAAPVLAAPALQRVELPLPSGAVLRAHWLPVEGDARRPAVLALHGCGGLYAKGGGLSVRYRETAERLHAAGYAVLMPDSFGSRGVREVCQTRYRERSVDVAQRAQDARAALAWLAAQPQVDVQRIGVLGWSNGATTTLTLLEQRRAHPEAGEPPLAGAAVFYPGCAPLHKRQALLENTPLLMLLGALDDWTPPQPCVDFARGLQARAGSDVSVHVYQDSYHGFDGMASVRLRTDVPNGALAQGVHQGGNPKARTEALAALDAFWSRVLGTRAAP
ncbi:hypothetical protein B2J88_21090 [Rhodococcus sp. SRB_17]|nr:hypothetical protein [Rhodococcus sp. SRB_17]